MVIEPYQEPDYFPICKGTLIKIDPVTAPRQSQRSKWKPSPHELRYRAFRDELRLKCNLAGFTPGEQLQMIFMIATPKSWSKKKTKEMLMKPHTSRGDIDNFSKAVMDALLPEDRHVWRIHACKFWASEGGIYLKNF